MVSVPFSFLPSLFALLALLSLAHPSPVVAQATNQAIVAIAAADIVAVRAVHAAFLPSIFAWFNESASFGDVAPTRIYGPDGKISFCCSARCSSYFPIQCTAQGRITGLFTGDEFGFTARHNYRSTNGVPASDLDLLGQPFGELSPAIGDLPELVSVFLANSRLAGALPDSLSRLQKLAVLGAPGNNFSGPVPRGVFRLPALRVVNLERNSLSGELPGEAAAPAVEGAGAGKLSAEVYSRSIEALLLRSNRLSGEIPRAITQMTALTRLDVGANRLSGGIPKELASFPRLDVARFDENELTGPFCQAILPAREVWVGFNDFGAEENAFHGCALPAQVHLLSAPRAGLRGSIPVNYFLQVNASGRFPLGPSCWGAVYRPLRLHLNLSGNSLTGSLKGFSVPEIAVLDLSHNGFTGSIPEVFYESLFAASTQDHRLDVRFNQLSGPVQKWWLNGDYDWDKLRVNNNSEHMARAVGKGCLPAPTPGVQPSAAETAALLAAGASPAVPGDGGMTSWASLLKSWDLDSSTPCAWYGVGCSADGHVDTLHLLGGENVTMHDGFLPESAECETDSHCNWACDKTPPEFPSPVRFFVDGLSGGVGSLSAALGELTHLTSLRISHHTLSGSLPHSLSLLTNLVFLDLGSNRHLSGPIPCSLYTISSLQELNLQENNLTGALIPDSSASILSPSLESLDVGGNALSGPIPASIGGLTSLCHLALDRNELQGRMPRQLGALWMLRELLLQGNLLQGDLTALAARFDPPAAAAAAAAVAAGSGAVSAAARSSPPTALWGLGGLFPLLTSLDLSSNQLCGNIHTLSPLPPTLSVFNTSFNQLSGSIPPISNRSACAVGVSHNRITGTLDEMLSGRPRLKVLRVSHNQISGTIPATLAVHAELDLSHNLLSGSIPSGIRLAYGVGAVDLSYNKLTGSIPGIYVVHIRRLDVSHNWLDGDFPLLGFTLEHLNASWNRFSGVYSGAFSFTSETLTVVDISHNRIQGSLLPPTLCSLCTHMDLSYNLFSGSIPPQLSPPDSPLSYLNLRNNLLSGPLPLALTQAPALTHLDLSGNKLNGSLPSFCQDQQQKLNTLLLSSNSFSGALSPLLSASSCTSSLLSLSLSRNQLSGPISESISLFTALHSLVASRNRISSSIPAELASLESMQELDLSWNGLSGVIPPLLGAATPSMGIQLAGNSLSGSVPQGLSYLRVASFRPGNAKLCSKPLPACKKPSKSRKGKW
ncbi:hypothetical protein CLOM_g21605 [Closterium sp. NIES-68]|nr:hypothetical protein CLOM_g21605 [Closterium sp. NIES-68]GJP68632.1 hypothetical protein CLOP_g25307 [Closterium sp. NIES-67]